jgi:hypothetical protein
MIIHRGQSVNNYQIPQNPNVGTNHPYPHYLVANEYGHLMMELNPLAPPVKVTIAGGIIHGDVFHAESAGAAMAPFVGGPAKTVTVRNVTNKAIRVAFGATPLEYIIISPNLSEDIHVVANSSELSAMRDDAGATPIRVETILHG